MSSSIRGVSRSCPSSFPHAVYNTGDTTLKVVGFFAAAELEHVFEQPLQPIGLSVVHTPMAEVPPSGEAWRAGGLSTRPPVWHVGQ